MNGPVGIVTGSGILLESLLDTVTKNQCFEEVPGLPPPGASGHAGRFLHGTCGGRPIILQSGRLHVYEGHDYATVTKPIEILRGHGVRTVILACAAGGLAPNLSPGDWVAVDRIRTWPYRRWTKHPGDLQPDLVISGCDHTGPYQWMHGPSYETPAEIAALQHLGMTVVGMSAAPELDRCRALGLRAAVIACVTNSCCRPHVLTHDEVVTTAQRASARLATLLRDALPAL